MEASTGYVFDGKQRPDPLKGALPLRDRAFHPRPSRPREEIAFRVRFRFGTDPEGEYRVTPPMWEYDAVSLRDTYAATETVDFDPRFPDGLEPLEGWSLRPTKAHNFERPPVPAMRPLHERQAAAWGDYLLTTAKTRPEWLIQRIGSVVESLSKLTCSEYEEAVAIIGEYITVPLPHEGPLHHDALH